MAIFIMTIFISSYQWRAQDFKIKRRVRVSFNTIATYHEDTLVVLILNIRFCFPFSTLYKYIDIKYDFIKIIKLII